MYTSSPVRRSADSSTSNMMVSWLSQVGPVRWQRSRAGDCRESVTGKRSWLPVSRLSISPLNAPTSRWIQRLPCAQGGADHGGPQGPGRGDHRPAGLDDDRDLVGQSGQASRDRRRVIRQRRHGARIAGGEAAADVHHLEEHLLGGELVHHLGDGAQRRPPGLRQQHLGADVEGDAVRAQPPVAGAQQQAGGRLDVDAELALAGHAAADLVGGEPHVRRPRRGRAAASLSSSSSESKAKRHTAFRVRAGDVRRPA